MGEKSLAYAIFLILLLSVSPTTSQELNLEADLTTSGLNDGTYRPQGLNFSLNHVYNTYSGVSRDVTSNGSILYMAHDIGGIVTFDITNQTHPISTGQISSTLTIERVHIHGSYVYGFTKYYDKMEVLQLVNNQYERVGEYTFYEIDYTNFPSAHFDNGYLYLFYHDPTNSLEVYDLTDPMSPALQQVLSQFNDLNFHISVPFTVNNSLLYVVDKDKQFRMFNISDAGNPVLLASTTLDDIILENYETVNNLVVFNEFVVFSPRNGDLSLVNVTNPGSVSTIDTTINWFESSKDYDSHSDLIFVSSSQSGTFKIFNMSNPQTPVLLFTSERLDEDRAIDVVFPMIYASTSLYGVDVFQFDLLSTQRTSIFNFDGSLPEESIFFGQYLIVNTRFRDVIIFDVSSKVFDRVKTFPVISFPSTDLRPEIFDILIYENHLYIMINDHLQVYNIASLLDGNPEGITWASSIALPDTYPSMGISNGRLVVFNYDALIIDIDDPAALSIIGSKQFFNGYSSGDKVIAYNEFLVHLSGEKVTLFKVNETDHINQFSTISHETYNSNGVDIAIVGDFLILTKYSVDVFMYDLSDPFNPTLASTAVNLMDLNTVGIVEDIVLAGSASYDFKAFEIDGDDINVFSEYPEALFFPETDSRNYFQTLRHISASPENPLIAISAGLHGVYLFDYQIDHDLDGLYDDEEVEIGTDPNDPDSDDDGLLDGQEEILYDTDPNDPDSDNDGINDGDEVEQGSDPLISDEAQNTEETTETSLPEPLSYPLFLSILAFVPLLVTHRRRST